MIIFLKGLYQTLFAKLPLWYCSLVVGEKDQWALIRKRLSQKQYRYKKEARTKIFAIYSVINWEQVFTEQLNRLGEFYLFTWPDLTSFFENKEEWKKYHDKLNTDLIKAFNEMYDEDSNILIFFYTADLFISAQTLHQLNKKNTFLISFCWDDLLYFKDTVKGQPVGVSQLSRHVDVNLTMSPQTISRYNYHNSPCFFWSSLPLNISVSKEIEIPHYSKFYVLFIGSKYGWRGKFISRLIQKGIPVICYGTGWENGYLPNEEVSKAIKDAPLTLGFANAGYTKIITTIKGRDFEVPLFGGLYLTQFSEGIVKYYTPGEEVLTYSNFSECVEIINKVKRQPIWANQVRTSGYKKALQYSSWDSRFLYLQQLLEKSRDLILLDE